jgi:hypothetical protein
MIPNGYHSYFSLGALDSGDNFDLEFQVFNPRGQHIAQREVVQASLRLQTCLHPYYVISQGKDLRVHRGITQRID